jgi:hypothetical protein
LSDYGKQNSLNWLLCAILFLFNFNHLCVCNIVLFVNLLYAHKHVVAFFTSSTAWWVGFILTTRSWNLNCCLCIGECVRL